MLAPRESRTARAVFVVAFHHEADPAGQIECGVSVGGEAAQELQRLGDVAAFDLAPGEHQDNRVGDGGAEALGHLGVVGIGGC
ncbi:MAG: hypothetical protein NFW16_11895 [Candidatus Accumulibacter sp.]|uniref:hypothetical protein n=1 Tax=Accumulibacter sp. TaxID=2053492 RepID=UPI002588C3E6|nr:hypothetical protein [Accumulibacter sp.]MCM8622407.1 hypothetical protein [Accumulibacter sp.]